MIHARDDYNRFQDPALDNPSLLAPGSSPIAADEPVFLLRAHDRHFVSMLEHYARLVDNDENVSLGDSAVFHTLLFRHAELAKAWQSAHGCKSPDLHYASNGPFEGDSEE